MIEENIIPVAIIVGGYSLYLVYKFYIAKQQPQEESTK